MAAVQDASGIPSLSLLYKLKKLGQEGSVPVAGASPVHNDRIALHHGDITKLPVDAIVNAANNSLLGGGGVDGAIHRAAGPGLLAECRTLDGCETGSTKITDAYLLPCKKVLHTVGPVYDDIHPDRSERALRSCYQTSLQTAVENSLKSVAFSAISTGIYGYPSSDACAVACDTVKTFLDSEDGKKLDQVVFVTFEGKDAHAYKRTLPLFFPPTTALSSGQEEAQQKRAEEQTAEAEAKASQLPDVPTTDPATVGHAQKKQKQDE